MWTIVDNVLRECHAVWTIVGNVYRECHAVWTIVGNVFRECHAVWRLKTCSVDFAKENKQAHCNIKD